MRAGLLLVIAGARAAPELVVEVEVNGKMQELRASRHDDPRRAAHAFCIKHNLTVSVENMACGEMLAEELVEKGARYPLPSEKLLRVRGGVVPAGPWRDRAQQLVPPHCPGEVLLPLVDGAIATPEIAVDISTEMGRVPFVHFDHALVNATAYPSNALHEVGEPLGRAASAFCSAWFCRRRAFTAHDLAVKLRRELLGDQSSDRPQRLVVSLSTLPGRISYLKDQLRFLYAQTRRPDAIYVVVPYTSLRGKGTYEIPSSLYEEADAGRIVLLRTQIDWGPATKLIPTLSVETDPRTIIITVDDDLDYPPTLIEHLYQAALQRPDAAIGLKGYWLPPTNTSDKERCDPRTWDHVSQERDYGYYSHENLLYTDAASTDRDVEVHVLGGLLGVAYRSGFFDLRRLVDFADWPGGSVFVDDDWISSVLDSARVPRVVLGLAGTQLADQIRNQPLVAPQSELEGLNSEAHAFRNVRLQNELLSEARARGLFPSTWDCRFDASGEDGGWVVALAALDDEYCSECRAPTIVVTDGNDEVLARYRARNGAVVINEDARALAEREASVDLAVVDSAVGAAAALRNRAHVVVSRGASDVLAALCAELGRGGVVAYKC